MTANPIELLTTRRGQLVRAVLLGALASGAGVALLGTAAWLLSRAAEQPPVMYLMVAIVGVRAFGIGKGVLRYVERLDSHDLALRLQAGLRLDTWRALTRSTWVGRRSGDLLSRVVNDVEAVQDLVVRVVVPFASAGLVALATTAVITVLSPGSGLLLALSVVLAGAVLPWLTARWAARGVDSLAPLRGELADVATEAADAAPDLIAYGATGSVLTRVADVDDRLRRAEQRVAWATGLAGLGQTLAAGVAVLGGLLVGAVAGAGRGAGPGPAGRAGADPAGAARGAVRPADRGPGLAPVAGALARVRAVLTAPAVGRGPAGRRAADRRRTSNGTAGPPGDRDRRPHRRLARRAPAVSGLDLWSPRASGSHWSGRAGRARPPSRPPRWVCCRRWPVGPRSAAGSGTWSRTRTCSTPPSRRTSGSASVTPPTTRSPWPWPGPGWTCRWTGWSGSTAPPSPVVRRGGSRWPGCWSGTRTC